MMIETRAGRRNTRRRSRSSAGAAASSPIIIDSLGSLDDPNSADLDAPEALSARVVQDALASGLTAVLYQTFREHSVVTRMYVTDANNLGDPVRSLIRERKIGQATTFVDQQMAQHEQAQMQQAHTPPHR